MEQIEHPLVSIVTITHNREKVIQRAVISVLNQTYKNIEYIIMDGASTDNTPSIIKAFAESDSRIKYHYFEKDPGSIKLMDLAIKLSIGDFICFLDDDDEYLPEKIEKQLKLLSTLPAKYGFVYCWAALYDDKKDCFIEDYRETLRGFAINEVLGKPALGCTPSLFFRREAFIKVGGWSSKFQMPSDWEMRARAAALYYVDFVPEVLVKIHINHIYERQSVIITKYNRNQVLLLLEFHEHFLTEFKQHFDKWPEKRIFHLQQIIKCSIATKNYSNTLKNAIKLLQIDFAQLPIIVRFIASGILRPAKN